MLHDQIAFDDRIDKPRANNLIRTLSVPNPDPLPPSQNLPTLPTRSESATSHITSSNRKSTIPPRTIPSRPSTYVAQPAPWDIQCFNNGREIELYGLDMAKPCVECRNEGFRTFDRCKILPGNYFNACNNCWAKGRASECVFEPDSNGEGKAPARR